MKALAAILVLILLFGCTAERAQQSAPEPDTSQQTYEEPPLPNTADISFEREGLPGADSGPGRPVFDFTNATDDEGRLRVHFFYVSTCPACRSIIPLVDELEADHPDAVFLRYDISTADGSFGYVAFSQGYGLDPNQRLVPQALVNGKVLAGTEQINESLEGIIIAADR